MKTAIYPHLRGLWLALALLVLCLPALTPFFGGLRETLPRTDDGNLHLYRAIVLDHSLQYDGWLYPRYASALIYGYGAPLFNYFPPTSYYPVVFLHRLGLSYPAAWSVAMMLFLWLAAGGAYRLGKSWAGSWGGYASAAAYSYAPYLLYNAVTRGTITEVAALAILPWVLWGFTRLAQSGARRDMMLAVLAYGLFIPVHNIVTVHGTLLLAAYCLLLSIHKRSLHTFGQLVLAGGFALALTAFFWLPALMETSFVRIEAITEALDFVDVTRTLRDIGEVLAFPRTADPTQLQAPTPISFGWPQIVLAAAGLALAIRRGRSTPVQWFALGVVLVTLVMQLPASAWLWENLPLIGFTQFAWRVLGVGSLALAVLAGIGAAEIVRDMASESRKLAGYSVLLLLIALFAIPWLYRPSIAVSAGSVLDAQEYERQTGELALSSYSEYLPHSTPPDLDPEGLRERFAQSPTPWRLQPNEDVEVLSVDWGGTRARLEFDTGTNTTLRFNWLYVPGWRATADDSPADVYPSDGFVAVDVDSNQHRLEIWLDRTSLQQGAELISLGAFFTLMLIMWRWPVRESVAEAPTSVHISLMVALVGLGLFAFKLLVIDTTNTPLRSERFRGGIEAGAEIALSADFQGGIRLLGASAPDSLQSGAEAEIRLFWTVSEAMVGRDYSSLLILREPGGQIIAEAQRFYPGGLATSNWLPGTYVEDRIDLYVPPFTPPGTYTIEVGLFVSTTGERMNLLGADGNPVGVSVPLDSIEVLPRTQPTATTDPLAAGDGLDLMALEGLPETAQVGDSLAFTWLWRATDALPEGLAARLIWRDEQGNATESPPIPLSIYPPDQWQVGEIWRGYPQLFVPATLDSGEYSVIIEVRDAAYPVGEMRITTPNRVYALPEFAHESGAMWVNGIILLGYDFTQNSADLHWQTTTLLDENLRIFVQFVDEDEQIVALTDGIPVDWTRPTTSWDQGEIISTNHHFSELPPGTYRVRVGWYAPESGNRVLLERGEDALILPVRLVIE